MRSKGRFSPYWSLLPLLSLAVVGWIGWNILHDLPSRYLSRLPHFVQNWVIPEPDSAILPAPDVTVDASALLALQPAAGAAPALPTASPTPASTATQAPTATPTATPLPTPTPTPLPTSARLSGISYQAQDWNNCGPATLAMALSYFGLARTQYETAAILKPNAEDRNVTPAEMVAYVNGQTPYRALERVNGSLDVLKQLLIQRIPVIIEVGDRAPTEVSWVDSEPGAAYREWWGHYLLAAGYDDAARQLFVYDSLIWDIPTETNSPQGDQYSYDDLAIFWPQFNRAYIVLYTPEQAGLVASILGPAVADDQMWRAAQAQAQADIGADQSNAFYWFNLGSALNALRQYDQAATAFDEARTLGLPWRMMWYQFGPYEAYYQVGRYVDVILLANATLEQRPYFEESFYYRGLAQLALGDPDGARDNFQAAINFNPQYEPAVRALANLNQPG